MLCKKFGVIIIKKRIGVKSMNVIYNSELYRVHDITNDSYIVIDETLGRLYLPKEKCEVA